MRKFLIRWWYRADHEEYAAWRLSEAIDAWEQRRRRVEDLPECGLSVRFLRESTREDVRIEMIAQFFASLPFPVAESPREG